MPMSRAGSNGVLALPIWTVPPSASCSPARIFSTVVLPQPEGPTSEISSPSCTSMVTSETARNSCAVRAIDLADIAQADEGLFGRHASHFCKFGGDKGVVAKVGMFAADAVDLAAFGRG